MTKMKKLVIALSMLYSLNSINNFVIAQIKKNSISVTDTIIKEKPRYAKELLDLEKQAGANVQLSHYQTLDSLVNELGKYVHIGGTDKDSKKIQAINNFESIDLAIKKGNFNYKENAELLFSEALKTKNLNSFHFLALYLEVASKKNLPIIPMKTGEHFFAGYSLDSLNSLNWETTFGIEQPKELYKKIIKNGKEIKDLTQDEFLSREYQDIGVYLNKNKQFKKSVEYLNKAIEINSADPKLYNFLGDSYSALGDYNNTLENYDMAINLEPKFTQAYVNRGNFFYKNNRLEKALEDYNKAIELSPENPEFYKIRGDIYSLLYKKTGDVWNGERKPKQAQENYKKALELILKK